MTDQFSPDERARLAPHFTNLDAPVFALVNLPEVVKGALFARYSRSPKSLRRLFLDEFVPPSDAVKRPVSIYPSKKQVDVLVFEPPIDTAKHLDLEMPATNYGSEGMVRFRIPINFVIPN